MTDAQAVQAVPAPGCRLFTLVRETDVTGISGTGVVAEGVEFSDGTVVLRWLASATARPGAGVRPTTVLHESIASVVALHGHGSSSFVLYANGERVYQLTWDLGVEQGVDLS